MIRQLASPTQYRAFWLTLLIVALFGGAMHSALADVTIQITEVKTKPEANKRLYEAKITAPLVNIHSDKLNITLGGQPLEEELAKARKKIDTEQQNEAMRQKFADHYTIPISVTEASWKQYGLEPKEQTLQVDYTLANGTQKLGTSGVPPFTHDPDKPPSSPGDDHKTGVINWPKTIGLIAGILVFLGVLFGICWNFSKEFQKTIRGLLPGSQPDKPDAVPNAKTQTTTSDVSGLDKLSGDIVNLLSAVEKQGKDIKSLQTDVKTLQEATGKVPALEQKLNVAEATIPNLETKSDAEKKQRMLTENLTDIANRLQAAETARAGAESNFLKRTDFNEDFLFREMLLPRLKAYVETQHSAYKARADKAGREPRFALPSLLKDEPYKAVMDSASTLSQTLMGLLNNEADAGKKEALRRAQSAAYNIWSNLGAAETARQTTAALAGGNGGSVDAPLGSLEKFPDAVTNDWQTRSRQASSVGIFAALSAFELKVQENLNKITSDIEQRLSGDDDADMSEQILKTKTIKWAQSYLLVVLKDGEKLIQICQDENFVKMSQNFISQFEAFKKAWEGFLRQTKIEAIRLKAGDKAEFSLSVKPIAVDSPDEWQGRAPGEVISQSKVGWTWDANVLEPAEVKIAGTATAPSA